MYNTLKVNYYFAMGNTLVTGMGILFVATMGISVGTTLGNTIIISKCE
jgi:hypothetical protein